MAGKRYKVWVFLTDDGKLKSWFGNCAVFNKKSRALDSDPDEIPIPATLTIEPAKPKRRKKNA